MVGEMKTWLLVLAVVVTWSQGQGTGLNFEISPVWALGSAKASKYNIRCGPDSSLVNAAKEIVTMHIKKSDGKILSVSLTQESKVPTLKHGSITKYTTTGQITTDVRSSYVQVSMLNPASTDSGVYTCQVFYINAQGLLKSVSEEGEIQVDNVVNNIQNLANRVAMLEEKVQTQEAREIVSRKTIQMLQSKVNAVEAFSATNNAKSHRLINKETLVFNDVTTKVGQGYDPATGKFTAPRAGIYAFHLVMTTHDTNGPVHYSLERNDKTVANMLAGDPRYYDQSSITSVLSLKKGDVVRAEVQITRANADYVHNGFSEFNGYLIKAL